MMPGPTNSVLITVGWTTIEIGEKSINPLCNRKVKEVLEKAGMHLICIEWSLGHNGEEEHRLKEPSRIATNTCGEFLVVGKNDETVKVFDGSGEFIYKINPQVDDTVTIDDVADVATDVNNNTYLLVWLVGREDYRCEVQVFTKTEMCNKFPVRDNSRRLTVGHDRVFVTRKCVIDVYVLSGISVCSFLSFEEETLHAVLDIAAGSDGQIFALEGRPTNENHIVRLFTKDGHQQHRFRVNSEEDVYFCLACHPRGEHIVLAGFDREMMHTESGDISQRWPV